MFIRICINDPVQMNSFLYPGGELLFLFPFYMITYHITRQDFRVLKRKVCMGEVINNCRICVNVTVNSKWILLLKC